MIHIDSTNRDIHQFPSNTKFEIPMNLTDNMERTNVKLNSDINFYFKWVGNSESNNPLSRITNDTFRTKIIPISFQKCIVVPVNDYVAQLINQKIILPEQNYGLTIIKNPAQLWIMTIQHKQSH